MDTKGIDRLSNLPCHLINEILKLLPLHDAVRTSILSREWRYTWRTIPNLVFGLGFERLLHGSHTIDSVVNQVLSLHRGAILKFTLLMITSDNDGSSFWAAVDQWLSFLSDHGIQELALWLTFSSLSRVLSNHLFCCFQLKRLCLFFCSLKPPVGFKGFSRLVRLCLYNVHLIEIECTKFISKCPILEDLEIYDYVDSNFVDLEIDAPNLKSFTFRGSGKWDSIYFKNTSFLEKVHIDFLKFPLSSSAVNLTEYFGRLSSIKQFELNGNFLQFLSTGNIPQKLPNNLSHLSEIKCWVDFAVMAKVSCVVCLMRSSPNLRLLIIKLLPSTHLDEDLKPSTEFLKDEQKLKINLKHLKYVKIDGFSGSKPEMEFVKLVLSGAPALIKLDLEYLRPLRYTSTEYLMELAEFPHASPEAKIITIHNGVFPHASSEAKIIT